MTLRCLFVDFDSFFASVEQHDDPALRGRPVAVIPVASTTTCCIAASKEAKRDFGIKTGTGVAEALERCPDIALQIARPQFDRRRRLTQPGRQIGNRVRSTAEGFGIGAYYPQNRAKIGDNRLQGQSKHISVVLDVYGNFEISTGNSPCLFRPQTDMVHHGVESPGHGTDFILGSNH